MLQNFIIDGRRPTKVDYILEKNGKKTKFYGVNEKMKCSLLSTLMEIFKVSLQDLELKTWIDSKPVPNLRGQRNPDLKEKMWFT